MWVARLGGINVVYSMGQELTLSREHIAMLQGLLQPLGPTIGPAGGPLGQSVRN